MKEYDYDIQTAFRAIENELIDSMMRNLERHKAQETAEGLQWEQWQARQLEALEKYRRKNPKKFNKEFADINSKIRKAIEEARADGQTDQEAQILDRIKSGVFTPKDRPSGSASAEFFKLNDRKLDALIEATTNDFDKAEHALLRRADDQYRRVIFNAQVYANTGAGTYEKAVDMATKDFLAKGLDCIEYKNGARHTLADYADMAIRTASKRAYLMGESEKREEWGIRTVIVNKRTNPCPKCLPYVGKVLIDDVYGKGSKKDGKYTLLSVAMANGFLHPRCKDAFTTYFPELDEELKKENQLTKKDVSEIEKTAKEEAEAQYVDRQVEKYGRLASFALDSENKRKYSVRKEEWKGRQTKTYSKQVDIEKTPKLVPAVIADVIDGDDIKAEDKIKIGSPGSTKSYKRSLADIKKGKAGLDKRRKNILRRAKNTGEIYRAEKGTISTRDLAYLSAATGDEFSLFRSKKNDILVHGDPRHCDIPDELNEEIISRGYEWVAHSHVDGGILMPSADDKRTLQILGQNESLIVGIDGEEKQFSKENY